MNRILLVLLGLVALFFGVRAIVHALASDETKIRWLLEDMTEGFNDTRMNPILSGLAQEFVDESSGADKELVRAGLAQLFLQSKDPKTKKFPYIVRVLENETKIDVTQGEPATARLECVVEFVTPHGPGEFELIWKVRIDGELARKDSWKFQRTRVHTLEGQRLR